MNDSASAPEPMAQLEIRKSADARLDVGGLGFVAGRREADVIDGGITLYGHSALPDDERELLRFDLFRNRPHYHAPATNEKETEIPTTGDVTEWGIDHLTRRTAELVSQGGFQDLVARLDLESIRRSAPALRQLLAGLAEATERSTFPIPAARLAALRG